LTISSPIFEALRTEKGILEPKSSFISQWGTPPILKNRTAQNFYFVICHSGKGYFMFPSAIGVLLRPELDATGAGWFRY
jgi:hypothetical protein